MEGLEAEDLSLQAEQAAQRRSVDQYLKVGRAGMGSGQIWYPVLRDWGPENVEYQTLVRPRRARPADWYGSTLRRVGGCCDR
jgi:hypothetical protein